MQMKWNKYNAWSLYSISEVIVMCNKNSAARFDKREGTTIFIYCKSTYLCLTSPGSGDF